MSNDNNNYYEGMFVTKGGGGEDAWDQSRSAVQDVLEDHDAEIDYVENWADQQFEKEIEKQRRGKYVLTYFQADPSVIQSIKDDTQLNERILRVLILNREKETTYRDMIQERIEAKKEEEEEEEEEAEEEEEDGEDVEEKEEDHGETEEGASEESETVEDETEAESAEEDDDEDSSESEASESESDEEQEGDEAIEEEQEAEEEELAKSEAAEASIDES